MSPNCNLASYTFAEEPSGDSYHDLLAHAACVCSHVLLVVRRTPKLSDNGSLLLQRIDQDKETEVEKAEWPGTKLLGDTAIVLTYRLTTSCASQLAGAANGLFDWIQPALPEDLCLLKGDKAWLTSITHEKDAFLTITKDDFLDLAHAIPRVTKLVRPDWVK